MQITREEFFGAFRDFKNDIMQAMDDRFRIFADIMRSETRAIIKQEVRPIVKEEITQAKKEIIAEITDFIGESIVPQLDDHDKRITHLETQYVK